MGARRYQDVERGSVQVSGGGVQVGGRITSSSSRPQTLCITLQFPASLLGAKMTDATALHSADIHSAAVMYLKK